MTPFDNAHDARSLATPAMPDNVISTDGLVTLGGDDIIETFSEDVDRFVASIRPLLLPSIDLLQRVNCLEDGRSLARACSDSAQTTGQPQAADIGGLTYKLLTEDPNFGLIQSTAKNRSIVGMGLGGLSLEAAVIVGGQVGVGAVVLWPQKIGTYRTPWKVKVRAWAAETIGADIGVSRGTLLGLTFWYVEPENTKHMVGAYFTIVVGAGIRVEVFGWVPEATDLGVGRRKINPFDYIMGFRIDVEVGFHALLGVLHKGRQAVSSGGIDGASYFLSPTTVVNGVTTTLQGKISAPSRSGNPSRILINGTSQLTLSFPSWMENCIDNQDVTVTGLDSWSLTGTPSSGTLTYTWIGTDKTAWQSDIDFEVQNVISNDGATSGQKGKAGASLSGLESYPGYVDISTVKKWNTMSLEDGVYFASVSWSLSVDPAYNTIDYHDDSTSIANSLTATNENQDQAPNNFYYIYDSTGANPNDPPYLTFQYINPNTNKITHYYVGYIFQQKAGADACQIRAVMWKVGSAFISANLYLGDWQTLNESGSMTSTSKFSDGEVTEGTLLTIDAIQIEEPPS